LRPIFLPDAKPVRLRADEVLFIASDPGDGCYRVEDGLA
jgi:CRP-like cAMP-binding protein